MCGRLTCALLTNIEIFYVFTDFRGKTNANIYGKYGSIFIRSLPAFFCLFRLSNNYLLEGEFIERVIAVRYAFVLERELFCDSLFDALFFHGLVLFFARPTVKTDRSFLNSQQKCPINSNKANDQNLAPCFNQAE